MTPQQLLGLAAQPGLPVRAVWRDLVVVVGAVVLNDGAAAEIVAVQIDRNHQPGAARACRRYRHRIDERAVHQPSPADPDRRKDAGQRIGGAHGIDEPPAREPDLVAGADLGGDGRKPQRQVFDAGCRRVLAPMTSARRPPPIKPDPARLKSR